MEIRDWLDHPVRGRIWIAVPGSRRAPKTLRDRVTWVVLRSELFEWGHERIWVGTETVRVSDPERTFLDCLHLPRHAGGIAEVATVLVRVWSRLDQDRLVGHLDRMHIDSVRFRLGYLVDALELPGSDRLLERLNSKSVRRRSPVLLDPSLPMEGPVDRRWGVRVNVEADELASAGQT
jgi:predicted transcriptional regulator of viral defense system